MKKLKAILSFVFALGIMCLGFSFAFNFDTKITASALSQTEIVENIMNGECVEKGGAIYLSAGSTYNMSGGEISGHFAEKGGALYISDGAVFTMTGGTITGNYAKYGGAIYVANGGECYINGGTITGNFAENAPAIYVESGGILEISDNALVDGNEYVKMSPTNINIYVDGELSKTIIAPVGATTYPLQESEMPLDYEHCCGYFLDEELTKTIKNDTIDLTSTGQEITFAPRTATASSEGVNIYTRTAKVHEDITFQLSESGDYYSMELPYEEGLDITSSQETEIIMPKEYAGLPVKKMNEYAYDVFDMSMGLYSLTIKSFILNDETEQITEGMFAYIKGDFELILPDSVTSIGDSAFYGCSGLTGSLTIPNSVTSIGSSAFYGCSGLTGSLTIPNSVTSIGGSAFYNCSGLTSVTIPDSVTSIGNYAFCGCSGLTSVIIPDSVTSIGDSAFEYCSGLTEVKVSSGNTVYEDRGKNAIIEKSTNTIIQGFNCTDLSVLEEVTIIGDRAFYYCSGLTGELIIPNNITSIGSSAFEYCSGLTGELIIPDSVTSIGSSAFGYCSGLTSVIIPESVTSIGNYAFCGCSGLTSVIIPDSVTSIGTSAFYRCSGLTGELIIPDSVTSIERWAFYYCTGLTSVYIPSTVTTITASSWSTAPFYSCSSSLVIYTDVTNASSKPSGWGKYWNYYTNGKQLQVVYGCSLDSEGNIVTPTTINFYVDGVYHSSITKAGTSYTVQESEMPLDYESCCGYFLNEELTETIKNDTIDLTNGDVNLYTKTADSSLFSFTTDGADGYILTNNSVVTYSGTEFNLIMPREYNGKTVTTIAYSAFRCKFDSCGSVNIIFSSEITEVPISCFDTDLGDYNCNIKSINIHNNITSIGNGAFYYCSGFTGSLIIGDGVTSIGDGAFFNCSGLTGSLTIPDSVTSIGDNAFSYCSKLTSVTIGNSVTSIGSSAFSSCSGLTSVTIPNSVTSIGSNAFNSCSGLTSVYIPRTVTTITASSYPYAPFYNCSSNLVIYTDVANASSKPSGWGTYWNYYGSGSTLTVKYGYSLAQYKAEVGLTFAPDSENISGAVVEVVKEGKAYQVENYYLQDVIIEKKEYILLPKELQIA